MLVAQEFRHAAQKPNESVSDFIRNLEKCFKLAYGRDGLTLETQCALLYAQMYEGLKLGLVKAPLVSGAQTYQALCIAAKAEEHRLSELRKRKQFQQPTGQKNGSSSERQSTKMSPAENNRSSTKSYQCGERGHFSYQCPKRKSESEGRRCKPSTSNRAVNKQVRSNNIPQEKPVSSRDDKDGKETPVDDPLEHLFSDLDDEAIKRVELEDQGSVPKCVEVLLQGIQVTGLIDSGVDISIMEGNCSRKC